MISKYFLRASLLITNLLLFSSCFRSSDDNMDYPVDPQIYAISISSKADTASLLPDVAFTIDQVNGKLFNREPLPYGFHVDSVMLTLSSSNSYFLFSKVELTLEADCTYIWLSDSIPIPRLSKIKTTAPDGITSKEYDFKLNIYQEDPYILTWKKISGDYLNYPVESQTTILYKNRFYTYYRSGDEIKAVSAAISDKPVWDSVILSGIPHTLRLSSVITSGDLIYALDAATGNVYCSSDGSSWAAVKTDYEVAALYGELPFATKGTILLAVTDGEKIKFGRANNNFSEIVLMNDLPVNMPTQNFSAMKVESATSYASKFLFLAGGDSAHDLFNNNIWMLQEDEGVIKYITSKMPRETVLIGSSLFFYDDKPYLMTMSAGENRLIYSENYGADWIKAGENQSLPDDFAARKHASVVTDANNNIWIFGGISSSNGQLVDLWKGRLNKFGID